MPSKSTKALIKKVTKMVQGSHTRKHRTKSKMLFRKADDKFLIFPELNNANKIMKKIKAKRKKTKFLVFPDY